MSGSNGKSSTIDLPVLVFLNEDGTSFFVRNGRKLQKYRMADSTDGYGLSLKNFAPSSLQRMMSIDYVSGVEISGCEFLSKRKDVLDISKLITFGVLYKQFNSETLSEILSSDMIVRWNRKNPTKTISERTRINEAVITEIKRRGNGILEDAYKNIITPIHVRIRHDTSLLEEERAILRLMSERFVDMLSPVIQFVLMKFRTESGYKILLDSIRDRLYKYIEKSRIAEYLGLMLLELIGHAENTNLKRYAEDLYQGNVDPNRVMFDSDLREQLLKEIIRRNDRTYICWKFREVSSGAANHNRLEVTIYNRESEYKNMQRLINDKKSIRVQENSLLDFYRLLPASGDSTELGLYYLSYLDEACRKVNIRLESTVSQIESKDLTVVSLRLNL